MKITYDVSYLPAQKGKGGKLSEEVQAVIKFLANGQQKNMVIEYEDLNDAKNKLGAIRRYQKQNNLEEVIEVYRVEMKIIVVKLKKQSRGKGAKNEQQD